jgi:hypothetical protein
MCPVQKSTGEFGMARKAKATPHLRLRIEPSLLARIEKSAAKNSRTLTGEISHRLEQSFAQQDTEETMKKVAHASAFNAVRLLIEHKSISGLFGLSGLFDRIVEKEPEGEK